MDNTILIIILVFVILKMFNKSNDHDKESFAFQKFPSKDFYGTPTFKVKIDCEKDPVTFRKFLEIEKRNKGKFSTENLSTDEKVYMSYRWKYANSCENNQYYSRGSFTI